MPRGPSVTGPPPPWQPGAARISSPLLSHPFLCRQDRHQQGTVLPLWRAGAASLTAASLRASRPLMPLQGEGGRGKGSRWLQRENSENEGLPGLAGESEARFLAPTLAVCVDVPVPVPNSAPLLKGRTSSRRIRAHTDGLTVP